MYVESNLDKALRLARESFKETKSSSKVKVVGKK